MDEGGPFCGFGSEPDLLAGGDRAQPCDRSHQGAAQAAADIDAALDMADPAPGPEAMAVAGGENERIQHCLDELEQDRAAAVRGAYLKGESYAELAERHGVPLNTMRTWLRRSLMKLRECLER